MAGVFFLKPFLRRWIFFLFSFTLALALLTGQGRPWLAQSGYPQIRGVWITNNDTIHFMDRNRTQESINQLARLQFNTLYPVVWNSGYILYESAIAKREGLQPFSPRGNQGQDVLADMITKAHRQNLLVMPWFEFGFMAPPFSELTKKHPKWFTQRQDGSKTSVSGAGEVVWLNPFHPQVQQFMTDLVLEVVTQYDVDGIQFDDHTCLPYEFGYDAYTISLYQQEMKKAPPSNPKDPSWVRWRADKLTEFIGRLNQAIKAKKPQILLSLSPATYSLAFNTYLQDWLDWVRKGFVDEVVVQVYRTKLSSFLEPIQRAEFQEAKKRVPTAVGILTGLKTKQVPMPLIEDKVRAASANGLGIAFFYYKSLWDIAPESKDQRLAQFQALWRSPARRSLSQKFIPELPLLVPDDPKAATTSPAKPPAPKKPTSVSPPKPSAPKNPTPVSPPKPPAPLAPDAILIPIQPHESESIPSQVVTPRPTADNFPPEPILDPNISPDFF